MGENNNAEPKLLRFNENEMLRYFESDEFDYIEYKYGPLLKSLEGNTRSAIKKRCIQYERSKNHNLYEKISYDDIRKTLKLIYNDPIESESFIFLYDFCLDHLIDRYINIPLLNKIYSHHYFEYEWKQHTEMNFEKNKPSFYRDHFIHSIRNCYTVIRCLEFHEQECGKDTFYGKIESTLKERTNSISQYACSQVERYRAHVKSVISENIIVHDAKNDKIVKVLNNNIDDFAWNYMIRGSLIVAALFHDIGYPIRYMYKSIDTVSDYVSAIIPEDNIGFDRLNNLLEGSLLFTVADKNGMRKQYDAKDHGALSAFVLLLQFYENGAIYELNPIKRAIIELAAVVIYDHTMKYRYIGDSDDGKNDIREKPSFKDNPLSYTLRFIDDIQEWDRMYFEMEGDNDYFFCEKCKMPMVSVRQGFYTRNILTPDNPFDPELMAKTDEEIKSIEKHIKTQSDRVANFEDYFSLDYINATHLTKIYICGCEGKTWTDDEINGAVQKSLFTDHYARTHIIKDRISDCHFSPGNIEEGCVFHRQKINYTMTCDEVVLIKEAHKDVFYIDYSPYSQLYLLTLNHEALQYRIKEIAKLNNQFKDQSDVNICMRTHITDNPMMLKLRVISDFIYETGAYIMADSNFEHNPYKRNSIYYGLFKDFMVFSGDDDFWLFNLTRDFVAELKSCGFLMSDYLQDGINIIQQTSAAESKSDKYAEYRKSNYKPQMCVLQDVPSLKDLERLQDTISEIVKSLIGSIDSPDNGAIFVSNLENTVRCYLQILVNYVAACSPNSKDTQNNPIRKWLTSEPKNKAYTDMENAYMKLEHTDEVYMKACKIVFRDLISQLYYYHAKDENNMEKYYKLRTTSIENRSDRDKEVKWSDPKYVVSPDDMGYALKILFNKKYYNPLTMSRIKNINISQVNESDPKKNLYGFTFFDINSDMYLFKELSRFTADNKKRRLNKD